MIDGFPYEMYFKLLHIFVPLLTLILNYWITRGGRAIYFQCLTMDVINLLCRNKPDEDEMNNFGLLTKLNT